MILEIVGFFVLFYFLGCFLFGFFLVTFGCGREGWRGAVLGGESGHEKKSRRKNNP